jgi:hypothetical protein
MNFYFSLLTRVASYFIQKQDYESAMKMEFLYPNNLIYIFNNKTGDLKIASYFSVLTVIGFLGYIIIMNRRLDYGE